MLGRLTVSLFATTSLVACIELASEEDEAAKQQASMHDELLALEKRYDRYRDIEAALADGFELGIVVGGNRIVTGCVAHPTAGAMGYHYFSPDRFNDAKVKELKPEALVYQLGDDGTLQLGAVEWVVPKVAWEALYGPGAAPPQVFGHALTVINPVLNWYVAHAWLWRENPSGVFSDWNPDVTCP